MPAVQVQPAAAAVDAPRQLLDAVRRQDVKTVLSLLSEIPSPAALARVIKDEV
jgi:hypothetical protein